MHLSFPQTKSSLHISIPQSKFKHKCLPLDTLQELIDGVTACKIFWYHNSSDSADSKEKCTSPTCGNQNCAISDCRYQTGSNTQLIFMAVFIDLWPCLSNPNSAKLSCLSEVTLSPKDLGQLNMYSRKNKVSMNIETSIYHIVAFNQL